MFSVKKDPQSSLFRIIRDGLIKQWLRVYFRRMVFSGVENIQPDTATLWVGNHQNAFMDAFLPISKNPRAVWSLTRGDIFAKPWVAFLLNRMCLMPVYRKQDGPDFSEKTIKSFERVKWLFKERNAHVLIFAEANAKAESKLRPLTSGFARIAFDTATDAKNGNPNLHIQPFSVQYEEHTGFRREVRVHIHKAIPVKDYLTLYNSEPRKAILELKKVCTEALKQYLIHPADDPRSPEQHTRLLSWKAYQEGFSSFAESLNTTLPWHREFLAKPEEEKAALFAQVEMEQALEQKQEQEQGKSLQQQGQGQGQGHEYVHEHQEGKIFDEKGRLFSQFLEKGKMSLLGKIGNGLLALPAALYMYPTLRLAKKAVVNIKDAQFVTSIRFAAGMIASKVLIILFWLPLIAIFIHPIAALIWLLVLPMSQLHYLELVDRG
jgi:1-acyl-sn-glycerol-3-phosphate acyltransferase